MNNNPRFNQTESQSPDSLKSDIETTRQRMDDTIDALTSRLKGRHLLDEVIGLFRSSGSTGATQETMTKIREKVGQSASTALHSTVETVKAHPLPTILIGAGIAWLIFEKSRQNKGYVDYDPDFDARDQGAGWEDDVPYDYPAADLESGGSIYGNTPSYGTAGYASAGYGIAPPQSSQGNLTPMSGDEGYASEGYASGSGLKDQAAGKFQNAKEQAGQKLAGARDKLRETSARLGARGRETAHQLGAKVQSGYDVTRTRVASTVEQHPLESALACLAIGIIAGLAIPAPQAAVQAAAPTANRLRQRAREGSQELMQRGKSVAQAAVSAARETAQREGLTADALKEKATHVAQSARDAATETAKEGSGSGSNMPEGSTCDTGLPKSPNPPSTTATGF